MSDAAAAPRDRGTAEAPAEGPPPFWEWVVAALGLVLLLASVGYLAWHARFEPATPPDPVVEVTSVGAQGDRHLVLFRVHNRGTATAAALRITGELRREGQVVEQAETEFQHLPGRSSREAGLFFRNPPAQFELVLAPRSFQRP